MSRYIYNWFADLGEYIVGSRRNAALILILGLVVVLMVLAFTNMNFRMPSTKYVVVPNTH